MAGLAKDSLNNLTGGGSVAYVAPQVPANGRIPLGIVNAGRYPLTGVTVVVEDITTFPFKISPTTVVGTLSSHIVRELDLSVAPVPGDNPPGVASFWIFIYAQNGTTRQLLQFRKGKKMLWDYRSTVSREVPSTTSMIPLYPKATSDVGLSLSYGWIEDREREARDKLRP